MKPILYILLALLAMQSSTAQPYRYLEPVFDEVNVTPDIPYGVNADLRSFLAFGEFQPWPLMMDVYQPAGDPEAFRPLVIVFHSGNFLPFPDNGSTQGTRRDSSTVEICRRLAKCGFVVASADYRLVWNPLAEDQFTRLATIINAAYRGVQDGRTCVRFFRKTFEEGNQFRIDTSRIVLWGEDTGGYLAAHASALDDYTKITENPQLQIAPGFYMVMENVHGDVNGESYGINDPPSPLMPGVPVGDTTSYPNHVGYSSSFKAAINMGGAVVDTSWIEAGQPPIISVHVPYDLTTPYDCGLVNIYIPEPVPIIDVCGSHAIALRSNSVGNTPPMEPKEYLIEEQYRITQVAGERQDGLPCLLPVFGTRVTDSSPWEFWDPISNINHEYGLLSNPDMSPVRGRLYLDSIFNYVLPRLYTYLSLASSGILTAEDAGLIVYPNPAREAVYVRHDPGYTPERIQLHDLQGRLWLSQPGVRTVVDVAQLPSGLYVLSILFDRGVSARIIAVE